MLDTEFVSGLALGAAGAVCMNVGKGVQKMKVEVLKHGLEAFRSPHRRDLVIWALGYAMTASAGIFYSLALARTDQPSVIAAMTGVGLVALVAFSAFVLREPVGRTEILGVALVVLGTVAVSAMHTTANMGGRFEVRELMLWAGSVLGMWVLPVTYTLLTGRFHGTIFGALAGSLIGVSMILGDIAMTEAGGSLIGQLKGPYVYLALLAGTSALVLTQVAFFKSRAVVVVPCSNSLMILVPVLLERAILGVTISPGQAAGMVVIVAGIVVMTATREPPPVAG